MLKKNQFVFSSYDDVIDSKQAIIRHDIDLSLDKALRIGEIEKSYNVKSTYFLLLSTDFYNVFSISGQKAINKLLQYGHEIGLHFDEQKYVKDAGNPDLICQHIISEAETLSKATGCPVTKVSMHRPSKGIIDCDLSIPGITNTYGAKYIKEYKYVSDSRRRWREPIDEYIENGSYDKLQILIHPFWYNDNELSLEESLSQFIKKAALDRYDELNENLANLEDILVREDFV